MRRALLAIALVGAALAAIASHAADAAPSQPSIPLVPGLVVSSAARWSFGDEEALTTITAADAQSVTYAVVAVVRDDKSARPRDFTRRVRREDLASARRIVGLMQAGDPDTFPGSTLLTLSSTTLAALKRDGRADVIVGTITDAEYEAEHRDESILRFVPAGRRYFRGTLAKVDAKPLPVLVNGAMTPLPAIAIKGTLRVGNDAVVVDHWVLDDPTHPLLLASARGRVVRIDFPQPRAQQPLEEALDEGDCRATLPGIYFDTGSATLLAPSNAALDTAAAVLRDHRDWTLTIEGHTDNIGTTVYNQRLSERRAAAVQAALLDRRGIAPAQLSVVGFGASRPIADNATLEGRAANRRVVLARDCAPPASTKE